MSNSRVSLKVRVAFSSIIIHGQWPILLCQTNHIMIRYHSKKLYIKLNIYLSIPCLFTCPQTAIFRKDPLKQWKITTRPIQKMDNLIFSSLFTYISILRTVCHCTPRFKDNQQRGITWWIFITNMTYLNRHAAGPAHIGVEILHKKVIHIRTSAWNRKHNRRM